MSVGWLIKEYAAGQLAPPEPTRYPSQGVVPCRALNGLAVLVAVLGALAPVLTHALMPTAMAGTQGVEICTTEGPRWVAEEDGASAAREASAPLPTSTSNPTHCQFCLQTTDRSALPSDPLPSPSSPGWTTALAVGRLFIPPLRLCASTQGPPDSSELSANLPNLG
jgi:hypothetical protein